MSPQLGLKWATLAPEGSLGAPNVSEETLDVCTRRSSSCWKGFRWTFVSPCVLIYTLCRSSADLHANNHSLSVCDANNYSQSFGKLLQALVYTATYNKPLSRGRHSLLALFAHLLKVHHSSAQDSHLAGSPLSSERGLRHAGPFLPVVSFARCWVQLLHV